MQSLELSEHQTSLSLDVGGRKSQGLIAIFNWILES